jgi:hypothetical protein
MHDLVNASQPEAVSPTDAAAAPPAARMRQTLGATLLFVALTAALTWPQALVLSTHAQNHEDVYFNMWRLRWVAHALAEDRAHLFEANIFHPEPRTLTLSDAMIVEGITGAPLLWAGLPPVLVHNLLLFGAIVASAAGIFVLARSLTGSPAAGIIAGIIFAFAPYRVDHYMHMELQWTVWIPWTFWAMHRTLDTGRFKYGLLTGLFFSLQMLSSVYYGAFLGMSLAVAGGLLLARNVRNFGRSVRAFAPGLALAIVVCGLYSRPYLETSRAVGDRSLNEIRTFSARRSSYLISTPDNILWGDTLSDRSRPERRLFPGALALILAGVGLLVRRQSMVLAAYLAAAFFLYEFSLGFSGSIYAVLYDHFPLVHGLRAIARAGVFVLFCIAVLAAFGFSAVMTLAPARLRRTLALAVCVVLLLEYRVGPLALSRFENDPSPVEAWLSEQPPGVVAHLPMGDPNALPGPEAHYTYLSSFHWKPIVNGYSGFYPGSFLDRARAMRGFPGEDALARLRHDGVRYIVVHMEDYPADQHSVIREVMTTRYGLPELARFVRGPSETIVWGLQ